MFAQSRGDESIQLGEESEDYLLTGPTDIGTTNALEIVKQPLSGLVEKLNELFGADLIDADTLTFVQL